MYALIWSKIGAEQKGAPRHRLTASPVQYRSLGFMFRRHPDRRTRRTTISVSSGEDQKRRSCQTDSRTRPHRRRTDLYFSVLEPFRTFSFRTEKGKPFVASARRKCRFLYFYFINRDFG